MKKPNIKGFKNIEDFINEEYVYLNLNKEPATEPDVTLGKLDSKNDIDIINKIKLTLLNSTIEEMIDRVIEQKIKLENKTLIKIFKSTAMSFFMKLDHEKMVKLIEKINKNDVYKFNIEEFTNVPKDLISEISNKFEGVLSKQEIEEFFRLVLGGTRGAWGPGEIALVFLTTLSKSEVGDLQDENNNILEIKAERGRPGGDRFWGNTREDIINKFKLSEKDIVDLTRRDGLGKETSKKLFEILQRIKKQDTELTTFIDSLSNYMSGKPSAVLSGHFSKIKDIFKNCKDNIEMMKAILTLHLYMYQNLENKHKNAFFQCLMLISSDGSKCLILDFSKNFEETFKAILNYTKDTGLNWEFNKNQMPIELK